MGERRSGDGFDGARVGGEVDVSNSEGEDAGQMWWVRGQKGQKEATCYRVSKHQANLQGSENARNKYNRE